MASAQVWGLGLAGSGVATATLYPDYLASSVIWVNFTSGSDANAGTEPELPVKTIAQAVTNASAGSTINIVAGNLEPLTAQVAVNKAALRFVGNGVGTNRPQFTINSGATSMFNVTTADCAFEGIYFKAALATSGTGGRVVCTASGLELIECQIDCGAFDQEGVLLNAGADNARIDGCSFTAVGSRPTRAIGLAGAPNTNVKIIDTTVDGSTFGWAGNAVTTSNCVRMVIKNITLAGNSDLSGSTMTSYQIYGVTTSGASKVVIS